MLLKVNLLNWKILLFSAKISPIFKNAFLMNESSDAVIISKKHRFQLFLIFGFKKTYRTSKNVNITTASLMLSRVDLTFFTKNNKRFAEKCFWVGKSNVKLHFFISDGLQITCKVNRGFVNAGRKKMRISIFETRIRGVLILILLAERRYTAKKSYIQLQYL